MTSKRLTINIMEISSVLKNTDKEFSLPTGKWLKPTTKLDTHIP